VAVRAGTSPDCPSGHALAPWLDQKLSGEAEVDDIDESLVAWLKIVYNS
jgi:hypothetical protein